MGRFVRKLHGKSLEEKLMLPNHKHTKKTKLNWALKINFAVGGARKMYFPLSSWPTVVIK